MENPLDTFSVSQSQLLVEAIISANEFLEAEESQFPTITHNGRSGRFWDLLNSNIDELPSSELSCNLQKFGPWGMLFILEQKSGIVFTLMKKQRIEILQRSKTEEMPKYLKASLMKNANLKPKEKPLNLDLFPFLEEEQEKDFVLFDNDNFGFYGQSVTQYGIIVFDISGGRVSFLQAIIPDKYLEPIYSKNLLKETKAEMSIIVSLSEKKKSVGLKLSEKAKKHKEEKKTFMPLEINTDEIINNESPQ